MYVLANKIALNPPSIRPAKPLKTPISAISRGVMFGGGGGGGAFTILGKTNIYIKSKKKRLKSWYI